MIELDESFDGRSVTLRVGDRIELALAENASTGYRWSPPSGRDSAGSSALREIDETFAAPGQRPGMPGAPGIRHLYFEAVTAGSADLELEYRRSWQPSAQAARTFRLRIEVLAEDAGSAMHGSGTGERR
jgi:predicted secreted protein